MNDKTKSNDLIINQQKSLAQEINKIKLDNKITGDLIEPEDDIKKNNKMNILASEQTNPEAPKKVINYKRISFIVIIMVILFCVGMFFIIKLIYQNMKKKRYNYIFYYGKENKITALYKGEYGQNINIINHSIYGRKISSYRINYGQRMLNLDLDYNNNYNNIRKNGKFYSSDNDTITIEIYFNSRLTSLNSMFEGCESLIYANLSDLVTYRLKSMSQVFTDCKSLQKVDLTSLDTSKVTTMDNLFEGCSNLVDIKGMGNLNTASLKSVKNMFVNCENLIFANLSAFELENIREKSRMFDNNPSLKYIDMSNSKYISFLTIFNISYFDNRNNTEKLLIKVNLTLEQNDFNNITWFKYIQKEDEFDISCTIGENEKCKKCSENNETLLNCETCNEGYYLPFGHMYTNTKCRKCEDNCSTCEGNYYNSYCKKCKDGFYLNKYYECKLNISQNGNEKQVNTTQKGNEEEESEKNENEKEQEKTESIYNEDNNQTVIEENEEKKEINNNDDDDKEKNKENEEKKESINDDDKEKNKENEDEKEQKEKNEEENKLNVTESDFSIEEGNKTEKEN